MFIQIQKNLIYPCKAFFQIQKNLFINNLMNLQINWWEMPLNCNLEEKTRKSF